MTLIFKIICSNCGFETKISDNAGSVVLCGLFIDGRSYHWTGFSNLEEYNKYIHELKQTTDKTADTQLKLKRELSLAKTRKRFDIGTFQCPKCGKDTLNWELIGGYET